MAWKDSSARSNHGRPRYFGSEDSLLFQLAPCHDVFRSDLALASNQAPWALFRARGRDDADHNDADDAGIWLGDFRHGRVRMRLDCALERGSFAQTDESWGPYRAGAVEAAARGGEAWQVEFAVDAVEVWAFDKEGVDPVDPLVYEDDGSGTESVYERFGFGGLDRARTSLLCS